MLKVGEKAPHFNLYNSDKEKVRLEQYKDGNLLILFFPLAFSSVCTTELSEVNNDLEAYKELNCSVIGVSTDSVFVLDVFKKELGLTYDLISDYNREMTRSYQTFHAEFAFDMKEVPKRSAFIINKKGIIKYVEVLENPGNKPDFDKIKKELKKLNQTKKVKKTS